MSSNLVFSKKRTKLTIVAITSAFSYFALLTIGRMPIVTRWIRASVWKGHLARLRELLCGGTASSGISAFRSVFSLRDFSVIGVRQRVSERFHARLYLFFTFASIVSEAAIFSFGTLAFTRRSGFKNGQFRTLCYPRFVLQFWYCFVFNIASTRLLFIDEPALVRG